MLSYAVDVTHNSPRPAPSAATTKSRPVTRLFPPPISKILIANPRLEFPLTHTKQTPLTFSNREYIAVFQILPSRRQSTNCSKPLHRVTPGPLTRNAGQPAVARVPTALLTHGRAFRTAGIPAGAVVVSRLVTHLPAVDQTPCRLLPLTSHKSPVARLYREDPPRRTTSHDFLIYGSAIRNPRNL